MTEHTPAWYTKVTTILLGLSLAVLILYVGRDVLIPLAYAALVSVLLHPVVSFLEKHKVPRLLAITIVVGIACIGVVALVTVIGMQISQLGEDLPRLKEAGREYVGKLQALITEHWGITYGEQLRWLERWLGQTQENAGGMVGRTFLAVVDMTSLAILVPLYVFVMLLYSNLLVAFVLRLASGWQAGVVKATLVEARAVVNKYMIGLMMETAIVAVLNSGALLLLGIDYAVLFGVLAAILNLIPYVGILIGGLLPMIMAIVTKDSLWYPIGVLGAFTLIQFIDNNLIIPYVVASRVSINALISIVAVIIGGMLWGVSGMFLALPAVAILKVIFDRVEHLAPWGLLLGDTIPAKQRNIRPGKRP
jgi:predicted PurR-regulated permease PerM